MFYVTSEIYLNNDLGSLAVSVDNYPQKRKNHLTITYVIILTGLPCPLTAGTPPCPPVMISLEVHHS